MDGIELITERVKVRMSSKEGSLYKKSQSGINPSAQSYAITPEDFDIQAGHDVSRFLRQNAKLECRGRKLVEVSKMMFPSSSVLHNINCCSYCDTLFTDLQANSCRER